jgi:predicted ATPase
LALQVAAHVLPRFLDGAWFVELASVGTDEAVEEAVASVLGVQSGPGRALEQAVLDYLRTKSLLLLLDNCEHVLGAVARFVDTALAVAPRLAVLATSREGLAVPGERLLTVPSLQTPDAHMTAADLIVTEAVRLFAERATDTRSSFDLSVDDAPTVGELCRRLDGIPLAIELAAARIGVMTPKEILDHLDRRFKLLTAGRRTAVTRHQTLQSTLDWSHELLEAADRVVFRRLSVFSGDFDLSAVEAIVVGEDLDTFEAAGLLFKLVEKSLVVAQPGSEVTRYRLLETIRDYAWERLVESGEGDDVSCRHCRHYLDLAERLGRDLCGPHELASKMRIEAELGNFRAALRWAVDDGDADTALRLVDGLAIVGSLPSPFGTVPLEAANMPGARGHPLAAVALASAAAASSTQGDHRQAAELVEAAIAAMPAGHGSALDDRAVCHTVSNVAMVAYTQADLPRFVDLARVWLEAARALGDPFEISQALNLLGGIVNDPDEAVDACEGALALARELGNPSRIAFSSISLGTRLGQFDVDRAHAVFEEALAAAVTARNDWVDSFAVQQLALLQARKGDYVRAVRTLIEVAERTTFKGDHFATSLSVTELAVLVASMGAGELALLLGTWAEQHGATYNTTNPAFMRELTGDYEALAQKVSPSDRRLLVQQVATLDAPGVVALARTYLDQVESSTRPTPG